LAAINATEPIPSLYELLSRTLALGPVDGEHGDVLVEASTACGALLTVLCKDVVILTAEPDGQANAMDATLPALLGLLYDCVGLALKFASGQELDVGDAVTEGLVEYIALHRAVFTPPCSLDPSAACIPKHPHFAGLASRPCNSGPASSRRNTQATFRALPRWPRCEWSTMPTRKRI
jgi:hypothetical protein